MCGIFAYSGPRPVTGVLLKGLKKLEYRGYDSSGVAFFKGKRIQSIKALGDISHLEKRLNEGPSDTLGMGHTRWATHGPPTEENAHPHKAGLVYVIHNGVIENEQSIRQMLSGKTLQSQTDSELIAHLIDSFCQDEESPSDFLTAVLKTKEILKGSYAVVALCEKNPGELLAFKNGPPLMLCQGEGEVFISSDPHAVSNQAKQVMFLEDGDTLHLKDQNFSVFDQSGKKVKRDFSLLTFQESFSEKKGYPHFMLKEIFEQPEILKRIVASHTKEDCLDFLQSVSNPDNFNKLLLNSSEIVMVSCGSSHHASLYGQYVIESLSGVKVRSELASEFVYRNPVISPQTTLLFISQSGETADTLAALKWAKKRGLPSISLCNVKNSTLDRLSNHSLYMNAGQEIGVASTKSFSASLLILNLLALHLTRLLDRLDKKQEKKFIKDLLSLPVYMQKVLTCDKFFLQQAENLKTFKGFLYLGRGAYYPLALEGALKLKEIAYTHAEGFPAGEMKHGPLALIDENRVVVVLIPTKGVLYEKTLVNLKEAKTRKAYIIAVGGGEELTSLCHHHLSLPEVDSLFHPLLSLIPLQMMAYFISRSYGYNADKPRNLAKSVTVE